MLYHKTPCKKCSKSTIVPETLEKLHHILRLCKNEDIGILVQRSQKRFPRGSLLSLTTVHVSYPIMVHLSLCC